MARSSYIYLVTDAKKTPLAAFTVKHELKSWMARQDSVLGYCFWRIGDGAYGHPPKDMAHEVLA